MFAAKHERRLSRLCRENDLPVGRVEQNVILSAFREIKHISQRSRDSIERSISDSAEFPVVLNESRDRRLVGDRAIHEVFFREW
jgi:hypothetical protein